MMFHFEYISLPWQASKLDFLEKPQIKNFVLLVFFIRNRSLLGYTTMDGTAYIVCTYYVAWQQSCDNDSTSNQGKKTLPRIRSVTLTKKIKTSNLVGKRLYFEISLHWREKWHDIRLSQMKIAILNIYLFIRSLFITIDFQNCNFIIWYNWCNLLSNYQS